MSNSGKNLKIKQTIQANKVRRARMEIKVFEVKIDQSHLSNKKQKLLNDCFVQSKWIYNYLISHDGLFEFSSAIKTIDVNIFNKDSGKCDIIENRNITIGSQIKQSIVDRTIQNIINLSKAKAKGIRVGKPKPAKEVNSVPLKQFGVTYKIKGRKYISIQGVGKLKVHGLEQTEGCEFANATLFRTKSGIFIKLTCYKNKETGVKAGVIGLDFGIKDSIITSDGDKFKWNFPISRELKRKQRKMSKKKKGGRNYVKQSDRVKKSYEKLTRQKDDAANQFVNKLKKYEKVVIQNENIKGWHAGLFGKSVQQSILGRIKTRIQNLETSVVIDRYLPTTKISPISGEIKSIKLNERLFVDGSFSEDRDIKSAKTILCFGLYKPNLTRKELMGLPAEERASIFSNYKFEVSKLFPVKQEALAL